MKQNKVVIGVTGTIASGKSTICRYMEEMYGAFRIDADIVARKVVEDFRMTLCELFGDSILTREDTVDRKALGAIVFSDPDKLKLLNETVHPETARRIGKMIEEAEASLVLVEAVELLRSDLRNMIDTAWVVYAEPKLRISRMMSVRGLSEKEAADRVSSQLDDETYRSMADVEIRSTDGPISLLTSQCDEALRKLFSDKDMSVMMEN